jgi:hypothetical protein
MMGEVAAVPSELNPGQRTLFTPHQENSMTPHLTLKATYCKGQGLHQVQVIHDDYDEGIKLKRQHPVLWDPHVGSGRTIAQAISDLKQRLYDYGQGFTFTHTIQG